MQPPVLRLAPSSSAPKKSYYNQLHHRHDATSITTHGTGAVHMQLPVVNVSSSIPNEVLSRVAENLMFKLAHTLSAIASIMQPQPSHMSTVSTWSSAWYLVVRTCTRWLIMSNINPRDGLESHQRMRRVRVGTVAVRRLGMFSSGWTACGWVASHLLCIALEVVVYVQR